MKKETLLSVVAILLLCVPAAFADGLTRIGDNIYAYVGQQDGSAAHSFAANAGIVIGEKGVLVVDTLISAKEGERFLADIRAVTDKQIKYVVNTHTHLDHAFGNCVFAKLDAVIISHAADREMLMKTGQATLENAGNYGLTPEDLAGTEIVLPDLSFSDRMQIDLGGEEVELIRTAPSHTEGSLVVFVPARKVLFAGDILFTDFHPYLADANLEGWGVSLDNLLAMDIERIVPGHGPLSSKKDLQDMKDYLQLFDFKAKALTAESRDGDAIALRLKEILPPRSMADWMIAVNVKSRYLPKATP